jgi:hypothetical protein
MKKKSIFRGFITSLRRRWKKDYPSIRQLEQTHDQLPKASTFYAGMSRFSGQHVYLNFQHSDKAWEVGSFTINIVLSLDKQKPRMKHPDQPDSHFGDGYHRIGHLIGTKDKWWHLKHDEDDILSPEFIESWRPSSYENTDLVVSEAVDAVTRDILSTMSLLDVPVEKSVSAA